MTKVYIKTRGCSLNKADGEYMAGLLKEAKFELVDDPEDAYVIILNSCTVKTPSEENLVKELNHYKGQYKIIIIAGCVPQADPEKYKGYALVGTKQIHRIVEVIEEALNDNLICNLSTEEIPSLHLPKLRKNPLIEIIPICRGCLGACTFCKTKAARGNLVSYAIKDIKLAARKAVQEGAKEIWLTSQDCGCYGFDLGTNLAELLEELVRVEGDFKIRVGTMNPDHLLKIKEQLFKAYEHEKVFKFLYLPVQSGNDYVLKAMNRNYTSEEFSKLAAEFKNRFPLSSLSTDMIVGFPGETDQQYWDTLNIVRKVSPDLLNINRFWVRSKTPAAKLKRRVKTEEIKRRARVLTEIFNNIGKLQNERWLGWEGEIVISEKGKDEREWIGKNFGYKQVVVQGDFKPGDKVRVKIDRITAVDLRGRVLRD
ncbi:MAG: tRNA (N(6)-L-threonylcarbamoyladenosine(37)-C(2))-methylthiotransferase [Candidatus Woesearchaeota archaeon]